MPCRLLFCVVVCRSYGWIYKCLLHGWEAMRGEEGSDSKERVLLCGRWVVRQSSAKSYVTFEISFKAGCSRSSYFGLSIGTNTLIHIHIRHLSHYGTFQLASCPTRPSTAFQQMSSARPSSDPLRFIRSRTRPVAQDSHHNRRKEIAKVTE